MVKKLLSLLKSLLGSHITNAIRPLGHGIKAYCAALYYGFPASKLTIIGITGTKGKTSTTIYTGRLLNKAGIKTGYLSTAVVYTGTADADQTTSIDTQHHESRNIYKMTSLDGVVLHKQLRTMVNNGCTHAVIELSSQGLVQNRHWGLGKINIGVFLNIFPEHLEAHGGWDRYLAAKSILFKNLDHTGVFIADGKNEFSEYMWNAIPNKTYVTKSLIYKGVDYSITRPRGQGATPQLILDKQLINHDFNAQFEMVNIVFAACVLKTVQDKELSPTQLSYIPTITTLPGRMQWVLQNGILVSDAGSTFDKTFKQIDVLVDYAHEPESMKQLLETLSSWKESRGYTHIIHILSCDGAGRDDWKKPILGDLSYTYADYTVVTTDNYSAGDNPQAITDLITQNYELTEGVKHFVVCIDRKKSFHKALEQAISTVTTNPKNTKILIVSTGVGSEYGLTQPKGVIAWDEAEVWKTCIKKYIKKPKIKPIRTTKASKRVKK